MEGNNSAEWGRAISDPLLDRWPKSDSGEPDEPVFLCKCESVDMSDKLRVNMLEAYGIPCLCIYPGDGSFGQVVMGMSGPGVEIYVPRELYEDAVALCEEDNNEEL